MIYGNSTSGQNSTTKPVELDINDLLELRSATVDTESKVLQENFTFPGQRPSRRRGQGLEFEDLREYTPGDDLRFIDWNVTARTSRLHTRLYRDERERTTTVIADLRSCMYTGTEALKSRRAVSDAARVLWNAVGNGDRCSAITFNDYAVEASRPLRGEAGVINACQLMADNYNKILHLSTAAASNTNKTKTLTDLLHLLLSAGRLTGYTFVFSGGDYLDQVSTSLLQDVSAKGQLLWVLLLDQAESGGLPGGRYSYHYGAGKQLNKNHADGVWQKIIANITNNNRSQLTQTLADQLASRQALFEKYEIPVLTLDNLDADRYLKANLSELQLI